MEEKPNTFVYHKFKAPKGVVVTASEAKRRRRWGWGWTDNPGMYGKGIRPRTLRIWHNFKDSKPLSKLWKVFIFILGGITLAAIGHYVPKILPPLGDKEEPPQVSPK